VGEVAGEPKRAPPNSTPMPPNNNDNATTMAVARPRRGRGGSGGAGGAGGAGGGWSIQGGSCDGRYGGAAGIWTAMAFTMQIEPVGRLRTRCANPQSCTRIPC
jgi:hypothetical protein